ncbi:MULTISPECIES: hypothetical protein [Bacillaceae]|uniref:DUF4367 domain-containing protein n=1 Tax=Evansella alkalicola TaxID=745819 RepID=A0ABS6JYV9_9BACI|nr:MULTISPECIES: hypothetical protein [Bacillaceae]MBU9723412.1 hypothetical protein [Bacillus alkalicola]
MKRFDENGPLDNNSTEYDQFEKEQPEKNQFGNDSVENGQLEKDQFEKDFQALKNKVTPLEKEKYDIFHQMNSKMEERVHARELRPSEESESQQTPWKYYASLGIAAVIVLLLFIPGLFPFSDEGGFVTSDDRGDGTEQNSEDDTTQLGSDEEDKVEGETYLLKEIIDLEDISWLEMRTKSEDESLYFYTDTTDNATDKLLQDLSQLQVEETFTGTFGLEDECDFWIKVSKDGGIYNTTNVYIMSEAGIYIQTSGNGLYVVSSDVSGEFSNRLQSMFSENVEVNSMLGGVCGYEESSSRSYRFRFDLRNGEAIHPIPCIQPIFNEDTYIYAGSSPMNPSALNAWENLGFSYWESVIDHEYQDVSIMLIDNDIDTTDGTPEKLIKAGDNYSIYVENRYKGAHGEITTYLADGVFNDEMTFYITINDKGEWFTEAEAIALIEEQLIPDILGE